MEVVAFLPLNAEKHDRLIVAGMRLNEGLFLGGRDKGPSLEAFSPESSSQRSASSHELDGTWRVVMFRTAFAIADPPST